MNKKSRVRILLDKEEDFNSLVFLQQQEEIFNLIEREYNVKIITRGRQFQLIGDKQSVEGARNSLEKVIVLSKNRLSITPREIRNIIKGEEELIGIEPLLYTTRGKKIIPHSKTQQEYIEAIKSFDLVFAIGPAGTGKTYLAVAAATLALKNKEVARIILTRPVVEAGEKLGFLPGDIHSKVDPYFRPLYDALFDMINIEKFNEYLATGIIEIAPLAYMRGRTLNDAFIILDEAQNTTSEQMKMFLTRLGFSSKAVITGDVTQSDLPPSTISGLIEAQKILANIDGIKFIYFTEQDVVRHELVQKIILAYEKK